MSETKTIDASPDDPKSKTTMLNLKPTANNIELDKTYDLLETLDESSDSESLESFEEAEEELEGTGESENLSDILDLDPEKFLESLFNSDEISLSEEEIERRGEDFVDILEVLAEVPHIEEVSLDLTDKSSEDIPTLFQKETLRDTGLFVDPLTGMVSTDKPKSGESSEYLPSQEGTIPEEIEEEESISLEDDFFQDFEEAVDDATTLPEPRVEDEMFEMFVETIKQEELKEKDQESILTEDVLILEEKKRALESNVKDFLNKLVDHCVTKAEYIDEDIILRRHLDKNKLIKEISLKYPIMELEKSRSRFLNRKVINHYRRKGFLSQIYAETGNNLIVQREKYNTAVKELDQALIREQKTKALNAAKIIELKEQFEETKQQTRAEIHNLEQLIEKTFQRKSMEVIQKLVDRQLNRMSTIREEISSVRFRLFLQQHKFSSLKLQMEKLEDLGNGLNIHDYESLETETIAISKKVEDQNISLNKVRDLLYNDVSKLSHVKARQHMVRHITAIHQDYFDEFVEDRRELREYINSLKNEHNRNRNEIEKLSHQTGLLSMPELMEDYDKTVETAQKLRQSNEDMKKTIEELTIKIEIMEKNCDAQM